MLYKITTELGLVTLYNISQIFTATKVGEMSDELECALSGTDGTFSLGCTHERAPKSMNACVSMCVCVCE